MKRFVIRAVILAVAILVTSSHVLFAESKNLKIAMIYWRGETKGCKGFKDGLRELGYTVAYTEWNAAQDNAELGRLMRHELEPHLDQFDYVYSFGTTVSKATKTFVKNRVPHVFNIVTAPVESGLVKSMDKPDVNVSGSTNGVTVESQLNTALKIFPVKRLGLLFNPREQNSMINRNRLKAAAEPMGIEVIDLRSPPAGNSLEKNLQQLLNKSIEVDAVYLPSDSHLLTHAKLIADQLKAGNIKSIAALEQYVENGALIGVAPDYYKFGKAVAAIVDRHQKGKPLEEIEVQSDKEPLMMINTTTATALGITIPAAILETATKIE